MGSTRPDPHPHSLGSPNRPAENYSGAPNRDRHNGTSCPRTYPYPYARQLERALWTLLDLAPKPGLAQPKPSTCSTIERSRPKLTSSSCVYSFGWPVIGEPNSAQIVPIYGRQEHRLGREPGPIKARAASYQAMPPSKPLSTDASSAPRTAKQGGNKLHRQAGFLRGLFLRRWVQRLAGLPGCFLALAPSPLLETALSLGPRHCLSADRSSCHDEQSPYGSEHGTRENPAPTQRSPCEGSGKEEAPARGAAPGLVVRELTGGILAAERTSYQSGSVVALWRHAAYCYKSTQIR